MMLNSRIRSLMIPIGLLLLTIVLYASSIRGQFQYSWDDNRYVFDNPYIQLTPQNVIDIFTKEYFAARIPMTLLGYQIQHTFFGFNAWGYFFVNFMLHGLNGILVFYFVRRLSGNQTVAVITAVLFIGHPINIESVAWISQLKSVLSMFFFLLAWLAHMQASDTPENGKARPNRSGWLIAAYVLFALAIMAKPTAVGGVILFALYDYWASGNQLVKIVIRNTPYAFIGMLGAIFILTAHSSGGGIHERLGTNLIENVFLAVRVYWDYLVSMIAPFNLNNMYVYSEADFRIGVMGLGAMLGVLGGFLLLVAMLIFAIWQPIGKPFCAFAMAWTVVLILPTANVVPIAIQRADRYMYYPSVLLFMLVAMASLMIWERFNSPAQRQLLSAFGGGALAVLLALTFTRVGVWYNTETLWEDHLTDYPNSETGLLNLSVGYHFNGKLAEANTTLSQLLTLYPNHYKGNRLMGLNYLNANDYVSAITYLERTAQLGGNRPDYDTREELGFAYFQEGLRRFEMQEYQNALALYNEAEPLVTADVRPIVFNNAGFTFQTIGSFPEAINAYQRAIELRPNYPLAWVNLGQVYLLQQNFANSRDAYDQAIALGAQLNAENNSNYCLVKGEMQDPIEEALQYCQLALDAESNNSLFLGRTAHVLLLYNQNENALRIAQSAVAANPTALGYRTLGDAQARLGDTNNAILSYRQALSLDPNNTRAREGLTALGVTP
jgi:protein O-mannosyl-transferase